MAVSIDLTGKRGVVFGVANQRSIALAISERLSEAGAELAFTYLNERLKEPVAKTIDKLNNPLLLQCDATQDDQVEAVYDHIKNEWKEIDFVVHCIAYAERDDLGGDFSSTDIKGFRTALETSAYTLMPVVGKAAPLFGESGGSVITLTFDASQRVYPGYNIMGTAKAALENEVRQLAVEFGDRNIRVNAISAGPLPTLAARSIPGFRDMTRIAGSDATIWQQILVDNAGRVRRKLDELIRLLENLQNAAQNDSDKLQRMLTSISDYKRRLDG